MAASNRTIALIAVPALIVALPLAVFVWPTRYRYATEKTGEYTRVIRMDRFSDRVWVLYPNGWRERGGLDMNPIDQALQSNSSTPATFPSDFWSQTKPPAPDSTPAPVPADTVKPTPKPKPEEQKQWATVRTQYSAVYRRCHFETGHESFVDGCDNVTPTASEVAELKGDDRVAILSGPVRSSNGTDIYKVKFEKWTGWIDASDLTPDSN